MLVEDSGALLAKLVAIALVGGGLLLEIAVVVAVLGKFLDGVENENIENDLNEILNNIANNKVYEFLKLVNGNDDFDALSLLNSLKIFDTDSVRIVKTG